MKFSTNINLQQNKIQNVVIDPLTTAPASPKEGQIYFNSTDKIGYQWNGTEWKALFRLNIDDTTSTTEDVWSSAKIQEELDNLADQLVGGMTFKGSYDASANTPDIESGTGIEVGDTYVVSADGTFFAEEVQVGDTIIAKTDGASAWVDYIVVNKNIPDIVDASNTDKGIIRIATDVEAITGTDELTSVNPKQLAAALQGTSFSTVKTLGDTEGVVTVTHNLGSVDTVVQFVDNATGETIVCDVLTRTANDITVQAYGTSSDYRIIIKK